MPVLTRSRVAIVVVALSLLTFLWTFGLPQDLPTPSLPVLHHEEPPSVEKPAVTGVRPYVHPPPAPPQEQEKKPDPPKEEKKKPEAKPTPTQIQEVTSGELGEEDDERPKKEDGNKEGEQAKATASINPATNVTSPASIADPPAPEETGPVNPCKQVEGAYDIMIIIKTSKAELDKKLQAHLSTLLTCVPNFAIFSDHSGEIAGHKIHDALADISPDARKSHDEFKDYQRMLDHPNDNVKEVNKDLDKWKILPMVYKAHKLRANSKFYFFIEADTSLSWTNALQWSARLDYRIPYYSGAPMFLDSVKFARRGSGIMLSYGAMKQYAKSYEERYASEWEPRVGRECCGDMVLATALGEAHVEFYSSFPLIQGETPASLDWTDRNWCAPVVTWHHMAGDDINSIWAHQQKWVEDRGWEVPYLFRDAFQDEVQGRLVDVKEEWDSGSSDTKIVKGAPVKAEDKPKDEEKKEGKRDDKKDEENKEPSNNIEDVFKKHGDAINAAADSASNCKDLCSKTEDCIQWKYLAKLQNEGKDSECHLARTLKLGEKREKSGDEKWMSGWMLERLKQRRLEWDKCEEIKWGFNQ